jgi:crossover junction endodeoxyribonuclease RusA
MITITLPWPPSVNHYWRTWRRPDADQPAGARISRAGRGNPQGRQHDASGRALAVHVELHPPDRRKRDVDNTFKAIGDSLQHGGAFQDDSQIVWLLLERAEGGAGGKVIVRVAEKTGDPLPFPTSECVCLN